MPSLAQAAGGFFSKVTHFTRRMFTGTPSAITPESHHSWVQEQVRVYATLQPYSSPLTTPDGGFSAGETWEMRRGYREAAMREPSVKSALLTKVMAVASLDPVIKPANKNRPRDKEAARWVDYAITNAEGGYPSLIMDTILPSLIDGFSVGEKVFDTVDEYAEDYPSWWTLKKVKSKDTEFIRFRLDTFRNVEAVQAMNAGQGGFPFDPADFLIFTHLSFFCNPFGLSDLRAANRAANLIEAAIKLRAIMLENYSGPYLVATAKDPATRNRCAEMLGKARARGWIVIPDGAALEVINLATSAPDQFQQSIRDYREEIVTAIQGAYLQLLEGGVANSRGNTQVHNTVAQLFQWWLAAQVCELFNHHLIPDLVIPNFGRRVGMPRMSLGGIDPAQVNSALDRFAKLQAMGLDLSKEQLYDEGYAEEPADDKDRLKPPSAQQGQAPAGTSAQLGSGPKPTGDDGNALGFSDDADAAPVVFHQLPMGYADWDDGLSRFVEWRPYTNSRTKKGGWISEGGKVRYDDPHKAAAVKKEKVTAANTAIAQAINDPSKMKPHHIEALHKHLETLPRDRLRQLAKQVSAKAGGLKVHLAERLIAHVEGRPQPSFDYGKKPPSDSLYAVVKRYGGIDPKSLAFLASYSGVKEAMENGLSLGLFKKGGNGLDALAQELHNSGHIQIPDDVHASEHLLNQLRDGVKTRHADTSKDYEAAESEYYRLLQEAEDYGTADRSAVKGALRSGEEAGRTAGAAYEVGGIRHGADDNRKRGSAARAKAVPVWERPGYSIPD